MISSLPAGEVPDRTDEVGYAIILADGMGGHAAGEVASRMAISGLMKLVIGLPDWIFRLDETVAADAQRPGIWGALSRSSMSATRARICFAGRVCIG